MKKPYTVFPKTGRIKNKGTGRNRLSSKEEEPLIKKLIGIILAIALLLGCAAAEETVKPALSKNLVILYTSDVHCGVSSRWGYAGLCFPAPPLRGGAIISVSLAYVTWLLNPNTGLLTITGTGPMWNYTYSDHSPFYENDAITSVAIGNGVTGIGAYMFQGCPNLVSVSIPESVNVLGSGAFNNCCSLDNVVVPVGVTSISGTFSGCTSLAAITLPDTVTMFGPAAFYGCAGLTDLDFVPDSVTRIQYNAFAGCTGLTAVYIPRGITAIEDYLFRYCTNLTSVAIHKDVTRIDRYVFDGCPNLQTVYYEGVRSEWDAIIIDPDGNDPLFAATLCCKSAVIFNSNGGSEVEMQALNYEECAAEPAEPTLAGHLFGGWYDNETCSGEAYDFTSPVYGDITLYARWLTYLKLPAGLTTIEDEAFSGVSAQAAVIPKTVIRINGNPFAGSDVTAVYGYLGNEAQTLATIGGYQFIQINDAWMANH